MGKQSAATKMVFIGFYFVGHPLSILLCFYFELGMMGLTLGFTCGSFAMGTLFYYSLAANCDWDKTAQEIRKKMRDDTHEQKENIDNVDLKAALLH